MAIAVVDCLELVHVQKNAAQASSIPNASFKFLRIQRKKTALVTQPSQVIGIGDPHQLLQDPFIFHPQLLFL